MGHRLKIRKMKQKPFSIKARIKSFEYAFRGLWHLLKEEHNYRIHIVVMIAVVAAGFIFRIEEWEWIAVIICIGLVLALEAINSALENFLDFVSPEKHEKVMKIKDLAAGAVLVFSIAAAIVGIKIFLPRLLNLL